MFLLRETLLIPLPTKTTLNNPAQIKFYYISYRYLEGVNVLNCEFDFLSSTTTNYCSKWIQTEHNTDKNHTIGERIIQIPLISDYNDFTSGSGILH